MYGNLYKTDKIMTAQSRKLRLFGVCDEQRQHSNSGNVHSKARDSVTAQTYENSVSDDQREHSNSENVHSKARDSVTAQTCENGVNFKIRLSIGLEKIKYYFLQDMHD